MDLANQSRSKPVEITQDIVMDLFNAKLSRLKFLEKDWIRNRKNELTTELMEIEIDIASLMDPTKLDHLLEINKKMLTDLACR